MSRRKMHRYSITSSAAERLGRLEIDDEFKLGWLHDRQVGRLFALEDTAGIDTSLTVGAVRFIPSLIRPPAEANSRNW